MKKTVIFLAAVLAAACSAAPDNAAPAVGSDRDTHGCIGSAGYTWSAVRQACVRLWEEGTALMPVVEIENPVLVAYVVRSANWKEAEVFLPNTQNALELTLQVNPAQTQWSDAGGEWQLFYNKEQGWLLTQNGAAVYQAPAQGN